MSPDADVLKFTDCGCCVMKKVCWLVWILILCLVLNLSLSGCLISQETSRKDVLLQNILSEKGTSFMFENLPWLMSKAGVLQSIGIQKGEYESVSSDQDAIRLKQPVYFSSPKTRVTVIYRFKQDMLVGGEYILEAASAADMLLICKSIADQMKQTSLLSSSAADIADLTEQTIRNGNLPLLQWAGQDQSLCSMTFNESDPIHILSISVRSPSVASLIAD